MKHVLSWGSGEGIFSSLQGLVSEESLLGHISEYLTILENGAWMVIGVTAFVGRSGMWDVFEERVGVGKGKYLGSWLLPWVRGGGVFILRTCHVFNHCDFFIPFS